MYRLDSIRIGSPCRERWTDMTGDAQVRLCAGCNRNVYNLSEMTRAEAEAVLAVRGVKPCVRFYRRSDGTIMTSDCRTTAKRSPRLTVLAAGTLLAASPAFADPAPDETPTDETPTDETPADETPGRSIEVNPHEREFEMGDPIDHDEEEVETTKRSPFEWSTWARAGLGVGSRPSTLVARTTTPVMPESTNIHEGALGLDVSVALGPHLRAGGWVEARTDTEPVVGGELIVRRLRDNGGLGVALRGGGNDHVVTGALSSGFVARDPWLQHGHTTGIRVVTSFTRSTDDRRDWSVTMGLELDPVAGLAYLAHRATR